VGRESRWWDPPAERQQLGEPVPAALHLHLFLPLFRFRPLCCRPSHTERGAKNLNVSNAVRGQGNKQVRLPSTKSLTNGPLTIASDLNFREFELILWSCCSERV